MAKKHRVDVYIHQDVPAQLGRRTEMSYQNQGTVVHISINDDGGFAYTVSTHRMTRKPEGVAEPKFRKIKWSAEGPFVIDFGDSSPFDRLSLKNEQQGPYESEEVVVDAAAALGRYRYAVAVCKNNQVYIDACPEIVVEC
jgi:hypothetical protein